jgi:hypothetical protein
MARDSRDGEKTGTHSSWQDNYAAPFEFGNEFTLEADADLSEAKYSNLALKSSKTSEKNCSYLEETLT